MVGFVRLSCTVLFVVFASSLVFLNGCAPPPPVKPAIEGVFFPEPPAPPRLQFLRSFTSAKDIEKGQSAFELFVTGEQKKVLRLDKPYGVGIRDGKIYVCDTNQSVMVFDLDKREFKRLEGAKGLGKLVQPLNISMDSDGTKYVVDPIRGQVVKYDRNDFYVTAFGMPGVWKPVDAVPFGDRLYVVDAKNREIVVFEKTSGTKLKTIGQKGEPDERLGLPTNIAFDKDGMMYISDAGRMQIVKYDRDGHFRGAIGKPGQNPGFFSRPRGVAVDRDGLVYAVDAAFDNVQIFNPDGQLLLFFGRAGNRPGDLSLPAKVAIDYDNIDYFREYADPNFDIKYLVFVTSQFGSRLVNVYGFGQERGRRYPTEEEIRKQAEERVKKWQEEHPEEAQGKKE